jgi:hypothetical protein
MTKTFTSYIVIVSIEDREDKIFIVEMPNSIVEIQHKSQILIAISDLFPTTNFKKIEIKETEVEPYVGETGIVIIESYK